MDSVALRLIGGQKSYQRGRRRQTVFAELDLEVRSGEVVAVVGPSGCGKSTLLRTLAGLEQLDAGDLAIGGPGRVGIAFQEPSLLPWLTVAQNVGLGLRFAANRAVRHGGGVTGTLEELGLAGVADAYPSELSGGQAQRANVARLLVAGLPILLLDEPFAALDPATRGALQEWLLDLRRHRSLTIVIVTHDLSEALRLGDRVAVMSGAPAKIQRTWDARKGAVLESARPTTEAVRREILAEYDVAPAPGGTASNVQPFAADPRGA
jgi:sulfate transport system ATP-binding protein/sulfonate transport system ATP-binding protein